MSILGASRTRCEAANLSDAETRLRRFTTEPASLHRSAPTSKRSSAGWIQRTSRYNSSFPSPYPSRGRPPGYESAPKKRRIGPAGTHSRPIPGSQRHCQLHGYGNHTSEQCRSLRARNKRSSPGAADAQPARPSSTPRANLPAPARKVTCYRCSEVGHYANECPQGKTTPANRGKNVVKRTSVKHVEVNSRTPIRPGDPIDGPQTLVPICINGQKHMAQLDTGASRSFISASLAAKVGATIEPRDGSVKLAVSKHTVPRIGVTSPMRIQYGPIDTTYQCEVLEELDDAQFLLGSDLFDRVKFDFSVIQREPSGTSDDAAQASDAQMPLVPPTFNADEESAESRRFRQAVTRAVDPELAVNATAPRASFCSIPEAKVRIPTDPGEVTFRRQYTLPQAQHDAIEAKLEAWLRDEVIEPVTAPTTFNTPFFLIPKKDPTGAKSDFRICHDFRPLNRLIPDDSTPLPLISDIFEALAGAQVFSTLDLWQAYHRFPIAEEDRHKTAFTWQGTQYQFRGAPFGLKTLPSHFQRVMSLLFRDLDYVRVFIDDIVVFSKLRDEHAAHLKEVIRRLNDANLILNVDKCQFARLEITLLGFRINPYGRSIDPSRLANLVDWPVPTTAKQLQSFLGLVNYLRDFVPKISTITAPLNAIRLKDNIPEQWTPECAHAFQLLKEIIPQCPPLAHPDFARPFYVATDASAVGIGCVLYQLDDKTNATQYIQFQARALRKSERNYSATKRELLAIVFALARFRHFIYGRHFTLYTDHHALVHLRTQPHLNAMMQTWYDELFEYDFTVKHRPGVQNVLPDHLSRLFPPLRLEGEGASAKATVNEPGAEEPAQSRVTVRKTTTTTADSDPHPAYTEPPADQRADIIRRHHLRGHFGIKATVDSIHEAGLDWTTLAAEVKEVCAKCLPCQRHNIARRGYHPLTTISADQPFDHVAIDLAGPFTASTRGNTYLFVLVDVHSRFVCLRAIPDKRMVTIGSTLFEVCTTFGFPKTIQSDNGTEFVNKVLKHLFTEANIDHRLVTPYHPRANGIAERSVQTTVTAIKKLLDGVHKDWDTAVPFVQFAMNSKVAAIHKSTPFAVVFGRGARPVCRVLHGRQDAEHAGRDEGQDSAHAGSTVPRHCGVGPFNPRGEEDILRRHTYADQHPDRLVRHDAQPDTTCEARPTFQGPIQSHREVQRRNLHPPGQHRGATSTQLPTVGTQTHLFRSSPRFGVLRDRGDPEPSWQEARVRVPDSLEALFRRSRLLGARIQLRRRDSYRQLLETPQATCLTLASSWEGVMWCDDHMSPTMMPHLAGFSLTHAFV